MNKLDSKDLDYVLSQGISELDVQEQIRLLKRKDSFVKLISPAIIGDGITLLDETEIDRLAHLYDRFSEKFKVVKFVPASGAASRMFKDLQQFLKDGLETEEVQTFFARRKDFAFWTDTLESLDRQSAIEKLLNHPDFSFGTLAKGSIPFHQHDQGSLTAFAEQLSEGADYACVGNEVRLHFTLPENRRSAIEQELKRESGRIGTQKELKFHIETSIQKTSTDTVALNEDGQLVRNEQGNILLRPGGHGALLMNLEQIDADIIFIKNIDNIVPSSKRADTITYKKALAGLLGELRSEARQLRDGLMSDKLTVEEGVKQLIGLGLKLEESRSKEELVELLNRPFRVCGMVVNKGEPGGGPFWIENESGQTSLQIVEAAQINRKDLTQKDIALNATHFNPVDLICCPKDLDGKKLDLLKHRDMNTSFLSSKIVNGKTVNILEWPGLWNGAMADWNTVFVQVPSSTFNPVKTVNDLLRPMHQA